MSKYFGLIAVSSVAIFLLPIFPVKAQLVPDNTLGTESSKVTSIDSVNDRIDGGASRGANLFHSFQEFNVGAGRGVSFFNPSGIENILTRVTGSNISNILGKLGVLGEANLFLINPNGIHFGENASLDIRGSFVGTTADGIGLGDDGFFSATDVAGSSLLSVQPSAIFATALANQLGEISNEGDLEVDAGRNLILIGGDVNIDGGSLFAPGGRIQLGGLKGEGSIADSLSLSNFAGIATSTSGTGNAGNVFINASKSISLSNVAIIQAATFALGNSGQINIEAEGASVSLEGFGTIISNSVGALSSPELGNFLGIGQGKNITIKARSISVTDGARIFTDTLGVGDAGNISIAATEFVNLENNSFITSTVQGGAIGKGGNIDLTVTEGSLTIANGAGISTGTSGKAQSEQMRADAGNINITVGESVEVTGAAQFRSDTFGEGDAGDITITAENGSVTFDGVELINSIPTVSGVGSNVNAIVDPNTGSPITTDIVRKGGDITIEANSVALKNGAVLSAGTFPFSQGDAGKISVTATDSITLEGDRTFDPILDNFGNPILNELGNPIVDKMGNPIPVTRISQINTAVNIEAIGKGGNIDLKATEGSLIADGASITTGTFGKATGENRANAGDINVTVGKDLMLSSGAQFRSDTFGEGDAGDITITAENGAVSFDGAELINGQPTVSGVGSNVNVNSFIDPNTNLTITFVGIGEGGDITIKANSVALKNGAALSASTFSQGDAGKISVTATDSITLEGDRTLEIPDNQGNLVPFTYLSQITTSVGAGAIGKGGNIDLKTTEGSLTLADRAQIITGTSGKAQTDENRADAGKIDVTVGKDLTVTGAAQFRSDTFGEGNAGDITITAQNGSVSFDGVELINGIPTPSGVGSNVNAIFDPNTGLPIPTGIIRKGGDITITANSVAVKNGAFLSAGTFSQGDAGKISVTATDSITLEGDRTFDPILDNFGNPILNDFGRPILDKMGNPIPVTRISQITTSVGAGAIGKGGDINLKTTEGSLTMADGAQITTGTSGKATAENRADAGDINVTVGKDLTLTGGAEFRSNTSGEGDAGDITITANDEVTFDGVELINIELVGIPTPSGVGSNVNAIFDPNTGSPSTTNIVRKGGDITIEANSVALKNGAVLSAGTFSPFSQGDAGKILITATDSITLEGDRTFAAGSFGNPVSVTRLSQITNTVGNQVVGQGKNIDLRVTEGSLTLADGASITTGTSGKATGENRADAGDINVTVGKDLTLSSGAQFRSDTSGEGDAGDITITAQNGAVTFDGAELINGQLLQSGVGSNVNVNFIDPKTNLPITVGIGKGGDIAITANSVALKNGAALSAGTVSQGDAGKISVTATDSITLEGDRTLPRLDNQGNPILDNQGNPVTFTYLSQINTSVAAGAIGKGGAIDLKATEGSLTMADGAGILTTTSGKAQTDENRADAGDINVTVGKDLTLTGGAQFRSDTFGEGDAGDIIITAENGAVTFDGAELINSQPLVSGISTGVGFDQNSNAIGNGRGGDIKITTNSLSLSNAAFINTSTAGNGNAGNVDIEVQDRVNLSDFVILNFDGKNQLFQGVIASEVGAVPNENNEIIRRGVGNAGNIEIKANSVALEDLAGITNSTRGIGNAGKISIEVDDSVNLDNGSVVVSDVAPGGEGNAGNIVVRSRTLSLTDGSQIGAAVDRQPIDAQGNPISDISGGTGNGGSIEINATDSVNISGFGSVKLPVSVPDFFDSSKPVRTEGYSSGILANTERGARGDAGTITVTTGALRVADGGIITTFTDNPGKAGDIAINARTFEATGGGQIVTSTRNRGSDENTGNAGNIILNIADSIKLSGSDRNFEARQNLFDNEVEKNDVIGNQGANSGIFANTSEGLTGDGGDIKIDPQTVVIEDGAKIAVNSQGSGTGGSINLTANNLSLDRGAITAATASQDGGNITLNVRDLLNLSNNSSISATAGQKGNGGNVTASANFILAYPKDNQIVAKAEEGNGGNINIDTNAIFGRQNLEISASSDFGLQGTVLITTPEVDPTSGLVELQGNTVDAADLVAQNPCRIENGQVAGGSTFVITGKGGLPPNPNETLTPIEGMVDWLQRPNPQPTEDKDSQSSQPKPKPVVLGEANKAEIPIQQAQGMVKKADGRVVLTATASSVTPQNPPLQPTTCKVK